MVSFHIFIWDAFVEWISSCPLKMKRKLARRWLKSSKYIHSLPTLTVEQVEDF